MEKVNLSDLTDYISTGNGVSNQQEVADLTANDPNVLRQNRADLTANDPNLKRRTIADLSQLPQEGSDAIPRYASVADAIANSDEFEEYLNQKRMERAALDDAIAEHNEEIAQILGEEVPEDITPEISEQSARELASMNINDKESREKALNADSSIIDDELDDEEKEFLEEDDNSYHFHKENNSVANTSIDTIEKRESTNITNNIKNGNIGENVSYDIDDEDFDDLVDDVDTNDTDEENLKELQDDLSKKITPVANKLDLSTFTIVNKPVSVNSVIETEEDIVVDWALMGSKTHIAMKQFSGTDITKLSESKGINPYNRLMNRYNIIFKHLVGHNKPSNVKELVKSVAFSDNDAFFGAIYVGAFKDANYIPYDCDNPRCKNTFMSDEMPIEECYKFSDDKAEEEFNRIRNGELYDISPLYVSAITQISDKFAIGFREPSIYDVLFEPALLDSKFAEKYSDIITVLAYIDKIYVIDKDNNSIYPVEAKQYKNNESKNVKSRIVQYAQILRSLTADQYNIITAYIQAVDKRTSTITWKIPECTCPKCGKVIKEREVDAQTLLFTRHQLAAIATITLS